MLVVSTILALGVGISLGMLGGGGSTLMLPLLVYVLHLDPRAAIATSLLVVSVTSAVGLVSHARAGRVQWTTGLIFGISGMVGAGLGARVAQRLPPTLLLAGFAVVMVATAGRMILGRNTPARSGRASVATRALLGTSVGTLSGLFGAGGGFLVVPALVTFAGLDMRLAIATSLMVIAMQAFAGFATHAAHVTLDVSLVATIAAATSIGALIGARWSNRINANALRRGFGMLVLVTGLGMLVREMPAMVLRRPEVPLLGIAAVAIAIALTVSREQVTEAPEPQR